MIDQKNGVTEVCRLLVVVVVLFSLINLAQPCNNGSCILLVHRVVPLARRHVPCGVRNSTHTAEHADPLTAGALSFLVLLSSKSDTSTPSPHPSKKYNVELKHSDPPLLLRKLCDNFCRCADGR